LAQHSIRPDRADEKKNGELYGDASNAPSIDCY
jgi:hypothetical protein